MRKVALGLLLLSVASAAAVADEKVSESAKTDFASYCASCHGVDGKGNGPLAPTLKIAPSDLTVIAKKNNGHFPYTMIRKTIESTELGLARAHGPREMPVWGPVFSQEPEGPVPGPVSGGGGLYGVSAVQCIHLAARARILNIVDYIESIQQK
jgi:mono/diheme cytochrome c family protein